jgi:hypothetical protein
MTHLWEALCAAYQIVGFESAAKRNNVFRDLVLARIIEPTSKIDAERVHSEVGVAPTPYATVKRRLPIYAQPRWRQSLATASARRASLGPAASVSKYSVEEHQAGRRLPRVRVLQGEARQVDQH